MPGLDLKVKSIFVRPFSVMHPKLVIIDRRQVWVPSCNVSWETWFEGCIILSGPITDQFVAFWQNFWARDEKILDIRQYATPSGPHAAPIFHSLPHHLFSPACSSLQRTGKPLYTSPQSLPSVFLPSPHHKNPRFRFLPWSQPAPPPPTPLNLFLLTLLENAKTSVSIQTPNLTSPPVLAAILSALQRGVHVGILTSASLMVAEQLVTAGTTTSRCIRALIRRYKKLRSEHQRRATDVESAAQAPPPLGTLEIEYFQPRAKHGREPVQSHIKLTIVDAEWVVLGSGNLDRASWYTSQELGVAFHDAELALRVAEVVGGKMSGRTRFVFDSDAV